MRVLFAASECAPLVKVGGLGDVVGSLPKALKKLGVDVGVVIPKYEEVNINNRTTEQSHSFTVDFGAADEEVKIHQTVIPGSDVPLYLLENERHLSSGGVYLSPDAVASTQEEIDRFAFFSKAVVGFQSSILNSQADIIHCHDWHTSLIPQLLRDQKPSPRRWAGKTILTIHNLANQGFSQIDVVKKLGLHLKDSRLLAWDAADGNLDFILQGITTADWITTVSPAYAREILTPRFGEGLDGVLRGREGRLVGILNGIDTGVWDPATDPFVNFQFSCLPVGTAIFNFQLGKRENKRALQEAWGLEVREDRLLIGMVTRLAEQKGISLVLSSLRDILDLGCQLVVLGVGDPALERELKVQSEKLKVRRGLVFVSQFDEALAHQIYAGADCFLMPSRFEPCGLTPMMAMRYGCLPIVHYVGGLKDIVEDGATGFVFKRFDTDSLMEAVGRAYDGFKVQGSGFREMVESAMNKDFSWNKSAKEYVRLYHNVVGMQPWERLETTR